MGEPPCLRWVFPVEGKYINAVISKLSKEFLGFEIYDDVPEASPEEKKNQ